MKENKYDDEAFFEKYSAFPRSVGGLTAAGEWHEFKKLLPDFAGQRVLDMGCGFGWHCIYAAEQGAAEVLGTDLSAKMLAKAREMTEYPQVTYRQAAIEDLSFDPERFDTVVSSLALHYVESFDAVCASAYEWLRANGTFVFSVEHPIFTAYGTQVGFTARTAASCTGPSTATFQRGGAMRCFSASRWSSTTKRLPPTCRALSKQVSSSKPSSSRSPRRTCWVRYPK